MSTYDDITNATVDALKSGMMQGAKILLSAMLQTWYIWLAVLVMYCILHFKKRKPPADFPYTKHSVMSIAELLYFNVLRQCVPTGYMLLSKVRLWDIIDTTAAANRTTYINMIKAKHVDFLLCDKDANPVLVIELDDKSHAAPERASRDSFIDNALAAAGISIIHQPCKASYSAAEVGASINRYLPLGK